MIVKDLEERGGMRRLGIIVNPIAGMGGKVGLKGTDGEEALRKALALGATPIAPSRARRYLRRLKGYELKVELYAAAGLMGEEEALEEGLKPVRVGGAKEKTGPEDTVEAAKAMAELGVELIAFVGGDGTARDVCRAINGRVPCIGIPSGVKVYSSAFGFSPENSAELTRLFFEGVAELKDCEVMDIDEEAFRRGELRVKLYGYLKCPYLPGYLQSAKGFEMEVDDSENKKAIARYVKEKLIEPGTIYILGPGTTVKAVAEELGVEKTPLGVDVYLDRKLIAKDVSEKDLLRILSKLNLPVKVVVSPLGRQGFILGRGNQQISPAVLRRAGREGLIVLATRAKLMETPALRVDTGDPELDKEFRGYLRVIIDYNEEALLKVV